MSRKQQPQVIDPVFEKIKSSAIEQFKTSISKKFCKHDNNLRRTSSSSLTKNIKTFHLYGNEENKGKAITDRFHDNSPDVWGTKSPRSGAHKYKIRNSNEREPLTFNENIPLELKKNVINVTEENLESINNYLNNNSSNSHKQRHSKEPKNNKVDIDGFKSNFKKNFYSSTAQENLNLPKSQFLKANASSQQLNVDFNTTSRTVQYQGQNDQRLGKINDSLKGLAKICFASDTQHEGDSQKNSNYTEYNNNTYLQKRKHHNNVSVGMQNHVADEKEDCIKSPVENKEENKKNVDKIVEHLSKLRSNDFYRESNSIVEKQKEFLVVIESISSKICSCDKSSENILKTKDYLKNLLEYEFANQRPNYKLMVSDLVNYLILISNTLKRYIEEQVEYKKIFVGTEKQIFNLDSGKTFSYTKSEMFREPCFDYMRKMIKYY